MSGSCTGSRRCAGPTRPPRRPSIYNGRTSPWATSPPKRHRYMLGSRSALEWLIDRYQVKTDKDSGIVNDPNDWCR